MGLLVAYFFSLLLIHMPGAFAHVVGGDFLLTRIWLSLPCVSRHSVRCAL